MASNSRVCRILIHNEQLKQVDMVLYLGSDYRRRWVYEGMPYQVKQGAGDRGITAENMQKSQNTEDTTNESASVACSNVRLWKLDTSENLRDLQNWIHSSPICSVPTK